MRPMAGEAQLHEVADDLVEQNQAWRGLLQHLPKHGIAWGLSTPVGVHHQLQVGARVHLMSQLTPERAYGCTVLLCHGLSPCLVPVEDEDAGFGGDLLIAEGFPDPPALPRPAPGS